MAKSAKCKSLAQGATLAACTSSTGNLVDNADSAAPETTLRSLTPDPPSQGKNNNNTGKRGAKSKISHSNSGPFQPPISLPTSKKVVDYHINPKTKATQTHQ